MPTAKPKPEGIVPDAVAREALIAALQSTSDAVVITGRDGAIRWVNSAFTALTGYWAVEVIGRNPRILKSGAHSQEFYRTMWDTLLAGRPWVGVLRNRRKDGSLYREQQSITPVFDNGGRVTQFVSIKRDLAAVERIEQLERDRAAQFRLLFEDAPTAYHQLDIRGRITQVNHAECELLGRSSEQLTGMAVWDLVAPEDREGSRDATLGKLSGEYPVIPITRSYLRADGSRAVLEIHEKLLRDETGATTGMLSALIDITTRMTFELALAESNARYEGLFDNSSDAIFIIRVTDDGGFVVEAANAAHEQASGLSNFEVEGKRIEDVLDREYAAKVVARYRACVESGEPLTYEDTIALPSGERTFLVQLFPVRHASGKISRLAGISRDITERLAVEQKLRDREHQLSLVLEGNKDGVWDWDIPSGRIDMSPRCFEMLGYEPGEIAPNLKAWQRLVHPEDRSEPLRRMHLHCSGSISTYEVEQRMRTKSGQWAWVLSRGKLVARDEAGRPLRAVGTNTDITARKLAEMALRDSEDRYRSVVSALAEGIIVRDAQGRITSCNAAACKILGVSEDQLLGRDSTGWGSVREDGSEFPLDEHPTTITLRTGKTLLNVVMGLPRPAGEMVWVSINSEPLMRPGEEKPYSVVVSFTDITEMRRTFRALEESRRAAESATHAKSDFLAMMSHEIRTPMNGVLGMCQLLMTTGLKAEQRSFANSISESAHALLAVINDILDISKIEAGRLELENAPFDLRKTLEGVINLLLPLAQRKGLRLNFGYSPGTPGWFVGDGARLRQIAMNLVGNAVKFTESGEVTLRVQWDKAVEITISDTGIGISPEDLPRLFSKFVQAGPVSRGRSGTGLGLAICKQLAELMGGSVQVRSVPGEGSTFTVRLPLPVADAQPLKPAGMASLGSVKGSSILLVDDNSVNQRVGVALLMKLGCTVATASDGEQAVSLAAQQRFDAILMDCKMPRMDGYEATQNIRTQESPDRRTPIIALTASAMEEDRHRCIAAGMDDYLSKPFQLDLLSKALSRWIQPTVSSVPVPARETPAGSAP